MNLTEYWYKALHSKVGIEVETDNPDRLVQGLYKARREAGDPDLDALSVVRSPVNPSKIWIIKRKSNVEAQE